MFNKSFLKVEWLFLCRDPCVYLKWLVSFFLSGSDFSGFILRTDFYKGESSSVTWFSYCGSEERVEGCSVVRTLQRERWTETRQAKASKPHNSFSNGISQWCQVRFNSWSSCLNFLNDLYYRYRVPLLKKNTFTVCVCVPCAHGVQRKTCRSGFSP